MNFYLGFHYWPKFPGCVEQYLAQVLNFSPSDMALDRDALGMVYFFV